MSGKKMLLILMVICISLSGLSTVSANDNSTAPDTSDEMLSAGDVTFTKLNDKINSNNESTVTLTEDYRFNSNTDSDFKNGIVISRPMNILGNGHTIDGANAARIFNITSKDVFISNVNFINGNADNGAAIIGEGYGVISCNFTSNTATANGGAMYGGTATDCRFTSNTASRGGAIYDGISRSSTFISNNAYYGGALFNSYVENSHFESNMGTYGGAMSGGSAFNCTYKKNQAKSSAGAGDFYAVNCTFIENKANKIGALQGIAIDCTFNGNSAFIEAGAMADNRATNCLFINNYAPYGGAMEGGSATNCTFENNHADYYGGAILGAYAENCTFEANHANQGGAMYDNSAKNCIFIENNATEGGALYKTFAVSSNFTKNTATNGGSIHSGSARYSNFEANSAKENGGALMASSAFSSNFKSNAAKSGGAMYGGSAIECDFTDNHADFGGAISGGCSASASSFIENIAAVSGGANYESSIVNCHLQGNLPKYKLSVIGFEAIYGFGGEINVKLSDSQNYEVKGVETEINIYDSSNNLVETDSCLSGYSCFVDLDLGQYRAVVSLKDESYVADDVSAQITIKTSTFIYVESITATYNINKPLIVNLHDSKGVVLRNAPVTITINGAAKTYHTDNNGQVLMSTAGLAPKIFTATISYSGNNVYFKSSATAKVTVKKAKPFLIANNMKYFAKEKIKRFKIILRNNVYKAIKNAKVTLKVNGKKYSAKTNSKGQAFFKINKLKKKGKFKTTITFSGNAYYSKVTKTVKITVKKP